MTKLSLEQSLELRLQQDRPLNVIDPETNKVYVIIASDLFEKIRPLFDEDTFDIRETYPAQQQAVGKVWDDPALDAYHDISSPPSA